MLLLMFGLLTVFAYIALKDKPYAGFLLVFASANFICEAYLQYLTLQLLTAPEGISTNTISWLTPNSQETSEVLLYQHISFGIVRLLTSLIGISVFPLLIYIMWTIITEIVIKKMYPE